MIDTKLDIEPETLSSWKSGVLLHGRGQVYDGIKDLDRANSIVQSELVGYTAAEASAAIQSATKSAQEIHDEIETFAGAVDSFVTMIRSCKTRLKDIEGRAATGKLIVIPKTSIELPPPPPPLPVPADPVTNATLIQAWTEYMEKQALYSTLAGEVSIVRRDEDVAHSELQNACSAVTSANWLVKAFTGMFSGGGTTLGFLKMLKSRTCDAVKLIKGINFKLNGATFDPKRLGKHFKDTPEVRFHTFKDKVNLGKGWGDSPEILDKVSKVTKHAGRVLTAVDAGTTAYDQWKTDSVLNPDMGTGEKVARAGTRTLLEVGGGWAGGKAGAMGGAAIGMAVGGPIGAAVGGIIGGVAGGAGGKWLGGKATDFTFGLFD